MATILETINNGLRLCGEQELLNTNSTLGSLARACLQTAVDEVVAQTRHSAFVELLTIAVTQTDYLLPAAAIPSTVVQVLDVFLRTTSTPASLVRLKQNNLESLDSNFDFSIVGSSIYLGWKLTRPLTLVLKTVRSVSASGLDSSNLDVPLELEAAVNHMLAALLAQSFVDDANNAALHLRTAQSIMQRVRNRKGLLSTTSFNMR